MLARIEGAPEGVKGISLFVVPKFLVNSDGSLGDRNAVSCGSIEHKMGIHGNATCVMNYDGATGWLVGAENKGLNAMFVMMNEARLGVAIQGLAQSEVAYQNAVAYAKDRIQGRALTGAKEPAKAADPIIVHPDVRRTLLTIRAFNEAARALVLWTALKSDVAHRSDDEKARKEADDHLGLMTPVLKGCCTDLGFDNCVKAQQMFGGHGYVEEWGMSQFVRDARIAMIYEGANGIQAMDLVGRKLPRDGGRAVMTFFNEVQGFIKANEGNEALKPLLAPLGKSLGHLQQATMWFMQNAMAKPTMPAPVHRLHAPLRPRGHGLHVGHAGEGRDRKLAAGANGSTERMNTKLVTGRALHGAHAARDRRASCPHLDRLGCHHGAAGGSFLSSGGAQQCAPLPSFKKTTTSKREAPMADAFVYDHVRTPRGKGKADGSLHEVTAVRLAETALRAIATRNNLEKGLVEDVILGCVDPVGEASGDIARSAAIAADYGFQVPGIQINRFCASGLDAVALRGAGHGGPEGSRVVGGGVESMSRVGMGASGMLPAVDPSVAIPSYFSPQGVAADLIATKYGFSRVTWMRWPWPRTRRRLPPGPRAASANRSCR